MAETKKYRLGLEGLPDNERIVFKLICSVSTRTKGRDKHYMLADKNQYEDVDLLIKNATVQLAGNENNVQAYRIELYDADGKEKEKNYQTFSKPLIATRVLAALDDFVSQSVEIINKEKVGSLISELSESETPVVGETSVSDKLDTLSFELSEQEASELAIVHDDTLTNPANTDSESLQDARTAKITPIKFCDHLNRAAKEENDLTEKVAHRTNSEETPRVLVVDDSPSVRKQLELELELFDVDADYAATAGEAMRLLNMDTYDVAFLDVVLPDKDGFTICRHIKQTSKNTSVIMLTGKAKQADKVKGALAGCDAYMVKPVGRITFQSIVKNYLTLINASTVIEA